MSTTPRRAKTTPASTSGSFAAKTNVETSQSLSPEGQESGPVSREEAVRIDTRLGELWTDIYALDDKRDQQIKYLHDALGHPFKSTRSGHRYLVPDEQALTEGREVLAGDRVIETQIDWQGRVRQLRDRERSDKVAVVTRALGRYDEYTAQIGDLEAEAAPLEAVYQNNPWPRFWLVKNNGGHIHSSRACHTTYVTTRFGWLPDLSGLTEKEAVDAHGAILCTVCFPSAPVEWTDGRKKDDDSCPGSGKPASAASDVRKGYASGNGGTCPDCGTWQAITSNGYGKIRKHKAVGK